MFQRGPELCRKLPVCHEHHTNHAQTWSSPVRAEENIFVQCTDISKGLATFCSRNSHELVIQQTQAPKHHA